MMWGNEPELGFGCMRLPVVDGDKSRVDVEEAARLFDAFLSRGFTYFDTGYPYHDYQGERAVYEALVKRHPRDAYRLATKLPLRDFEDADDMERIFAEQLATLGVEKLDCYLLHNMGSNVYAKCVEHDAFGFVQRKREAGYFDTVGMSFHDSPELLDEILSTYGEGIDFVQLQVNYLDWDDPTIRSRECLKVAVSHGKPVVVMEPVKGGALANVPEEAERILREARPDASPASWALRFAASQPGVVCVLSGMGALEHVLDNCAAFSPFESLTDDDVRVLHRVVDALQQSTAIACTSCEYCTHGCPVGIPIPRYFSLYNAHERVTEGRNSYVVYYNNLVKAGMAPAGACLECGACEQACPQHLPVRDLLKDVSSLFDNVSFPSRPR